MIPGVPWRAKTPYAWPGCQLLVDEGRFYGFPVHGVPGFKIGKYHHFEETGDPDVLDRAPHPYDEEVRVWQA